MTKTQFRLGALLILAAILLHNLTSPHRYSLQGEGDSRVKMDHVTGKTWGLALVDGESQWIVR
jgi:hypothetical protein